MNDDADTEVDLSSYAYQIWNNAVTADPSLRKKIESLPAVVYATKAHASRDLNREPDGVLVYMQTGDGNDALAWVDQNGNSVTQSQYAILRAAECDPDEPALARQQNHHQLVQRGVEKILKDESNVGGQLGRPTGARRRTYDRLQRYASNIAGTLFDDRELHKVIEDIYRFPLYQSATDALNAHLRTGGSDELLAQLAIRLRQDGRLCVIQDARPSRDATIICSMAFRNSD